MRWYEEYGITKPFYGDDWVCILNGDCREILPELPDKSVDLVLTSPPYDNLREYGGCGFQFYGIPYRLYQVMNDGACCVWVVGDQIIDGSETCSSFRQALEFKEVGFNLHDTMIYQKNNASLPDPKRYSQEFEYMFLFSKGRPKVFNPLVDRIRKWRGKSGHTKKRKPDGKMVYAHRNPSAISNKRGNIWLYDIGYGKGATDNIAFQHPATFPEKLAQDHIVSWSNVGDLILDPFLGSGTTAYCAKKLNRKCIGIEIEEKYCEIATNRCRQMVFNFAENTTTN